MAETQEEKSFSRTDRRRAFAVLLFLVGAVLSAWVGWNHLVLSIGTTVTVALNVPFVVRHGTWSAPRLAMISAETGYIGGALAVWIALFSANP